MKFAVSLAIFLICVTIAHSYGAYKFAGWGYPCKTGLDGSVVHPHDECEISKGFLCQTYEQGELCGCQIRGILSYDRRSKECRRRMGAVCYLPANPQEEQIMLFNAKCHENAYCADINGTQLHGYLRDPKYRYICMCKPNFHYRVHAFRPGHLDADMEECVSKNGALASILPNKVLFTTLLVTTLKMYA